MSSKCFEENNVNIVANVNIAVFLKKYVKNEETSQLRLLGLFLFLIYQYLIWFEIKYSWEKKFDLKIFEHQIKKQKIWFDLSWFFIYQAIIWFDLK